jgi:ABC-type branched-subunit amino acid transport system substrate-binding protein
MIGRFAIVAVAATLLAAGCGSRGPASSATSGPPQTAGSGLQASAVGISPTQIRIATIQDIGGPVPGLFESAKDAMVAFVAYVNSTGGVDGRKLVLDPFDAQISPTNFQVATQQACADDFAIVGSYSVGDNGGVAVGSQCGIPMVPAATTAPQVLAASNVVSPLPVKPNVFATGYYHWLAQTYPDAVKKAGILYPDNQVTRVAAARVVGTAETQGFHFVEDQQVNLIQVDFTSYILDMKRKGVQFFSWGADNQAAGRILTQAQQQGWHPQVFDLTAAAYTQTFLKASAPVAQGALISLPIALFEERSSNPAMATYLHWLDKAVPNHVPPDIFGVSAWSAGLLFVKALKQLGPNPTRSQLLSALHSIKYWNGDGIQAPSDPGDAGGTKCFVVVKVQGDRFVRVHPAAPNTFDCTGTEYTVPGIAPASSQ